MTFDRVKSGVTAGFVATVVLSVLMIAKSAIGLEPDLNPIKGIVSILEMVVGTPLPSPIGWVAHFCLGALVWGLAYAWLEPRLPGAPVIKGLEFGVMAWLAMMIVFMPLAGKGVFALAYGPSVMVAALGLHLIYGAILGPVYASQASGAEIADVRPN